MSNSLKSALLSPICQVGGLVLGIGAGGIVHGLLPGHTMDVQRVLPAAFFALLGLLGGGMAWGALIARLAGSPEAKRAAGAGAIWAAAMLIVMLAMQALEPALIENDALRMPIHNLYTLLFVLSTAIVSFVTAWAMAIALRRRERALRVALSAALLCALVYLIVNVGMDLLGWRVGAPRAAERFTMLAVTFVGSIAASATIGAVLVATFGERGVALRQALSTQA